MPRDSCTLTIALRLKDFRVSTCAQYPIQWLPRESNRRESRMASGRMDIYLIIMSLRAQMGEAIS